MLRASVVPCLALVLVGPLACTSGVGREEPSANAPPAATAPAIAKIVTRERSITLFAGHGSVRATVLDANGRLVARDVDIDALQNIDASAYETCHGSFAQRGEPPWERPSADFR
jgi:hypothetical protein